MSMTAESTSPSLLEALRGGRNERSWARFVACYDAMLLSFAKRLGLSDTDACDAVQETLLATYRAFQSMPEPFDRSKGRFRSWLRGIAKHKVQDIKKAKFKHAHASMSFDAGDQSLTSSGPVDTPQDEIDKAFDQAWKLNQVAQALELVKRESDPSVYQAFFLTFVEQQDAGRVGRLLGVSKNAVYVSKCKTLKKVRAAVLQIQRDEE